MIRPASWGPELVWGRPFSICSADGKSLTLFIQKVGRGTSRIAELEKGDSVTVWGPLGNGFAVEPETPTLMLAGGIGIAPFRGYIEQHPTSENLKLFFAHRMPRACYSYDSMTATVRHQSMVEQNPDDLQAIIKEMGVLIEQYKDGLILCCGPTPFMRTARKFALEHGARLQVSLENHMGCGVGACLGCVCKNDKDKYVQVCTNGPVFWADKVEL
ncbi:dihydroorotate dehydrogenase electron transfer subunit [Salidesulfovibrio onnuriiensis]|uniref:iron-sulfur cluster-binding protein n=1 Tax=Salidesulfovibrio onnuriiensis TaxID=2583823 RepID=UPI0032B73DA4